MPKTKWVSLFKWLLAVPVIITSTVAAAICIEFSFFVDRPIIVAASDLIGTIAPSMILVFTERLILLGIILLWLLPPILAVGCALGAKRCSSLRWGFTASLILLACFFWFKASYHGEKGTGWAIATAIMLLALERIVSSRKWLQLAAATATQCLALFVLFIPLVRKLAFAGRLPPKAQKLWSVALQTGTWQAMNTGSEFAATRQAVFSGDRIVVAFDSGYPSYQDKKPMSKYKVLSLERSTGTVKNQLEFTGQWGAMPYLLATSAGNVILANGNLQVFTPDLRSTGKSFMPDSGRINMISPDGGTLVWERSPGTILLDANTLQKVVTLPSSAPTSASSTAILMNNISWPVRYPQDHTFITRSDTDGEKLIYHGDCEGRPHFLSAYRILDTGCGSIRIMDNNGASLVTRQDAEDAYTFAGVNQQGTRFALQAHDERGDPSHLLYEQFFIYDANSASPIATIPVIDLPERQSWTAFSPDGHLFAVGNPNQLSLYKLP